jgi:fimbrial chaperone protein
MRTKSFGKWMGGCRKAAARSALAVATVIAAAPATAGSFQVNPVQLNLPAGRTSISMTLSNTDPQPLAIRAQVYRWVQKDGNDVYEPTQDVIVSPPIFTVPPAATQLVRVGLRSRTGDGAYRVILEEIPRPKAGNVNVALRLNLPLYLLAPGAAKPEMHWAMWQDAAGNMVVEGTNTGLRHLQVIEIDAAVGNGAAKVVSKDMGVVLPHSARQWNIGKQPDFRPGTPVVLKMQTASGPMQAQVVPLKR